MYNRMAEPGVENDKVAPTTDQPSPPPYQQPGGPQAQLGYPPQPQPGFPQAQPGFPQAQPGFVPMQSHASNTNTTVVIQQQPQQVVIQGPRGWSTGICSCFDDCGVCLLGWCCPCILQCIVSNNAGECCCVGAMCPIALRTKIRTRHNIAGSIADDCCTLGCCGPCAFCQMARELNIHGI